MSEHEGMLRELMTAVDSHRLMNKLAAIDPPEEDKRLYALVADIRRRLA